MLVPCATGGLLTPAAAGTVPCTVIAGAANNLLTDDAAAEVLRRRGIVYAPDFVANAGGAIHLVGREVLGWSAEHVADRTRAVGDTLTEVFADARTHGISTVEAAERVAARTLSGGPLR